MKIYAVYDEKAEMFGTPQFFKSDGMALRTLQDMVTQNESIIANHPEDFSLYRLGDYDDNQGLLFPVERPVLVVRAITLVGDKASKE